ncbi:MAG: hypothetical protein MJ252_09430 [archaeon]|nr:hypothetical protein [archaeon]
MKVFNTYDHLLPLYLSGSNENSFINYMSKIITKYSLTNIKLPPIVMNIEDELNSNNLLNFNNIEQEESFIERLDSEVNQNYGITSINSEKLLKKIINLFQSNTSIIFVDLSFVLYIEDISEIKSKIRTIFSYFNTLLLRENFSFIFRFYLFGGERLNLFKKINEIEYEFKKAVSIFPSRKYSYLLLYLFKEEIIKCSHKLNINPYFKDEILNNELKKEEYIYKNNWITNISWQYRNRADFLPEPYTSDIKPLLVYKKIYRISYNTSNQAFWFICATYHENSIIRKLRKKTILCKIAQFLSIKTERREIYPKQKTLIYKTVYDSQIENILPIVKHPLNKNEMHGDLIHLAYDQIFYLLQEEEKHKE